MKKVDVVIPVLNEENVLRQSINKLRNFLNENLNDFEYSIVIADNGSKDNTQKIAKELSQEFPEVNNVHLDKKGRGRALKKAWSESNADIVSYMDVDLSTELEAYPTMIRAIANNNYHLGTGTRLTKDSKTKRSFRRELISRTYNLLVKLILRTKFSDAQCGFKAMDRKLFKEIMPEIKDNEWFFDTELLTLTEKEGYNIYEIPVLWNEDIDSRVNILETALKYIRDLIRVRIYLWRKHWTKKK